MLANLKEWIVLLLLLSNTKKLSSNNCT